MTLAASSIPGATLFRHGKVREVYEAGPDRPDQLVMVASDRLSAFDVVLPTPIPDKGRVLTQLSNFWFGRTAKIVPNHLLETDLARFPAPFAKHRELAGRAVLVQRAERIDYECVARGYLAGSGWAEYRKSGTVAGERLPPGLQESARSAVIAPKRFVSDSTAMTSATRHRPRMSRVLSWTSGSPPCTRSRSLAS